MNNVTMLGLAAVCLSFFASCRAQTTQPVQPADRVVYAGKDGPGKGKHIVFVTGDEEYRSEEGMPQLARILAVHHGFRCTVLFAVDPKTGEIAPRNQTNIPGLEALDEADLLVIFTRFRDLPDDQMEHIDAYVESGRPIVGLRTATHAFKTKSKRWKSYDFRQKGGFGRRVLGETWIAHHGGHGRESTRGIIAKGAAQHPILTGIENGDVWDPSDVYRVRLPMLDDVRVLLLGEVLAGMKPDAEPVEGKKNDPRMPVAWCRLYEAKNGKKARVFCTTLGAARAFTQPGTRRLLVNACYWAVGLDDAIKPDSCVDIVGTFKPSRFGFGKHKTGVKPGDLR